MRLGNSIAIRALLKGLHARSRGSLIVFQPLLAGNPKARALLRIGPAHAFKGQAAFLNHIP